MMYHMLGKKDGRVSIHEAVRDSMTESREQERRGGEREEREKGERGGRSVGTTLKIRDSGSQREGKKTKRERRGRIGRDQGIVRASKREAMIQMAEGGLMRKESRGQCLREEEAPGMRGEQQEETVTLR